MRTLELQLLPFTFHLVILFTLKKQKKNGKMLEMAGLADLNYARLIVLCKDEFVHGTRILFYFFLPFFLLSQ